jgi:hypothetical protein
MVGIEADGHAAKKVAFEPTVGPVTQNAARDLPLFEIWRRRVRIPRNRKDVLAHRPPIIVTAIAAAKIAANSRSFTAKARPQPKEASIESANNSH